jgi:GNAT superfamily N-acetyltransferase
MTLTITAERPDTPDAVALITELDAYLIPLAPAESRHGMSVEALLKQGVDFFVARQDGQAIGCAGVLCVGREYAEVKRMYVRPAARGQGVGAQLLAYLEAFAQARGITTLRLETGEAQVEAQRLYTRVGYRPIGPFGPYRPDPLSRFYEKQLTETSADRTEREP